MDFSIYRRPQEDLPSIEKLFKMFYVHKISERYLIFRSPLEGLYFIEDLWKVENLHYMEEVWKEDL